MPGSSSIIMTDAVVCLTNSVNVPFEIPDLLRTFFMDTVRFSIRESPFMEICREWVETVMAGLGFH
jgi:hypothetical protein